MFKRLLVSLKTCACFELGKVRPYWVGVSLFKEMQLN